MAGVSNNGVFETLGEVIDFYNLGGGQDDPLKPVVLQPLGLTADEKTALLAFLESLSSPEPVTMEPPDVGCHVAALCAQAVEKMRRARSYSSAARERSPS